ncbi:hypothetical protein QBC35DRAFT_277903 [Podospora australis]|uniref:G-patch domain-containing protein n=1 Tax=Podospora australis TaxID=1536484 RepID=A0AAN6X224_9PEZI|nr:hypothetical protein QBC35DRAFT_277903 [Podospora australis]
MNASRLLQSQGWRGKGFSLHPTDNSIGLSKPIGISRNTDGRGIGTKTHHTSDQWWLDAFDQKLKGLDTSKKGGVTQTVTSGKLDSASAAVGTGIYGKWTGTNGLYASFVKGGLLEGSVEVEFSSETATPVSGGSESGRGETWREKKLRRRAKKAAKEEERKAKEQRKKEREARKMGEKGTETKEERRIRKEERRKRKEERRRRRERKAEKVKK